LDQGLIDWPWPNGSNPTGTTILFNTPVFDFSLLAGDFGGDNDSPLMISAFDSADNLLGTYSVNWDESASAPFATLFLDLNGISKVVCNSGGLFANSTFIDNITFTPVPVPSTILLLGTVLIGLLGLRKKKLLKK
jgi:hypothetical protein